MNNTQFKIKDIYDYRRNEYVSCYRVLSGCFPMWLEAKPETKGGENRLFGFWVEAYIFYCDIYLYCYYAFGGDREPQDFRFLTYLKGENYISAMYRKLTR